MMKKPSGISPILKRMSHELGLEKEMGLYRLKQAWPKLVGDTIAAHTAPQKMKFKTLTLLVDSPVWMHELTFLKTALIEKINGSLGAGTIQTLLLKVGTLPVQKALKSKRSRREYKSLTDEDRDFIAEQLSGVLDLQLKEVIQRAMARHLSSKKRH